MDIQAKVLFQDVVADADVESVQHMLACAVNEWFFPELTKNQPQVWVGLAEKDTYIESEVIMDIQAKVLFQDVVADADVESVQYTLACAVNEWFFPELTKNQPQVWVGLAEDVQPLTAKKTQRHILAISDQHLGDGGFRDNFAHMANGQREYEFLTFLDYAEAMAAQVVICGDFFELWQSNVSKVITKRKALLDRLAAMEVIYVLGNHDADLRYFMFGENEWLSHPFFNRMTDHYTANVAGKQVRFIHGHQADPYCDGDTPGLGRISAIYSGIWEDRNGGPTTKKFGPARTVEDATVGRVERLMTFFRKILGRPGRFEEINQKLIELFHLSLCDILVTGHTHRAGRIRGHEIYNTGTWAEKTCSFVSVDRLGRVGVWDWVDGAPHPNNTILEC